MWEKIETWHWTILVAVISVLSVLLFQQQVLAQWTPPTDTPGGTNLERIVVTPMEEPLDMDGKSIVDPTTDANFYIDPANASGIDIRATKASFDELCVNGTCETAWPSGGSGGATNLWSTSTTNENNIYYNTGKVGIGVSSPGYTLHLADGDGQVKLTGNRLYHPDGTTFTLQSGGDLKLSPGSVPRIYMIGSTGNIGIRYSTPGYPLHVADNDDTSILNIDNLGDDLWTGTRLARDGAERWFVGMADTAEGTGDELLFRANGSSNLMTLKSSGDLGLGTTDPGADFEIKKSKAAGDTVDLRLWNTNSSNSRIVFKEYDTAEDFKIMYNGDNNTINNGYSNWLEILGRNEAQEGGRPIISFQRDYITSGFPVGTEPTYHGVGIGVESELNIDAKLRVQNYGTEDILQLYDNGTKFFTAEDGGRVGIGYGDPSYRLHVNKAGSDLYAAKFTGGLSVKDDGENYMQLDYTSTAPTGSCNSNTDYKGRMIFQYESTGTGKLWVCNYNGWSYMQMSQ